MPTPPYLPPSRSREGPGEGEPNRSDLFPTGQPWNKSAGAVSRVGPANVRFALSRDRSRPTIRFSGRALACVRGERAVFSNLDFVLGEGETLVLTGPNGSGKSSLLRMMAGFLPPVSGAIEWEGANIAEDREVHATRLHYVGHLDAVKLALTAAENLRFWAALRPDGKGTGPALEQFGISALADLPARFLSAGQRRRLALARIAVSKAPLWLLDEPTVALDADGVAAVHAAIRGHCAGGGSCVVSTNTSLNLPDATFLDMGSRGVDAGDRE